MIIIAKKEDTPYYDIKHLSDRFKEWYKEKLDGKKDLVDSFASVKIVKGKIYYYQRTLVEGKSVYRRLNLDKDEDLLLTKQLLRKYDYLRDLESCRYDVRLSARAAKIKVPPIVREYDTVCGYPIIGKLPPYTEFRHGKGIFLRMLYEEFERSLANFKSIKENVANLPEGNLIYKKIKGKAYSYIVKKDITGKRVYSRSFYYNGERYELKTPGSVEKFLDLKSSRDYNESKCRRLLKNIYLLRKAIQIHKDTRS